MVQLSSAISYLTNKKLKENLFLWALIFWLSYHRNFKLNSSHLNPRRHSTPSPVWTDIPLQSRTFLDPFCGYQSWRSIHQDFDLWAAVVEKVVPQYGNMQYVVKFPCKGYKMKYVFGNKSTSSKEVKIAALRAIKTGHHFRKKKFSIMQDNVLKNWYS